LFLLCMTLSQIAAAVEPVDQGANCSPKTCGNLTIADPFGFVPEQATDTKCGRMGFEVHCNNSVPYLGYYRRKYRFRILDIFYDNASWLVADAQKLEDFSNSTSERCHAPSNNSSSKLGIQFSISPVNRDLILYNCTRPLPEEVWRREGLVEMSCGNRTFARVADDRSDGDPGGYGSYFLEGCNATVVPVLARSG